VRTARKPEKNQPRSGDRFYEFLGFEYSIQQPTT
jgi:hypothetical protein